MYNFIPGQILRRPILVFADDRKSAEAGDTMSGCYLPTLIPKELVGRKGRDRF
jgi:hypothetical protein